MTTEKRKGLPIQALGLKNGKEGIADGIKTNTVPYTNGSGKVVFKGRIAETASMLLALYG